MALIPGNPGRQSLKPDNKYYVTFDPDSKTPPVVVLLAGAPTTVIGGYGGWDVVARPKRMGLTIWRGKEPLRMTIPILFDGWAEGKGQEIAISHLSGMALVPGDPERASSQEPPVIKVKGPGVPNPGVAKWVIESLDWGTDVIQDFADDGVMVRMRQDCVVHLLQYVEEDRVSFKNIKLGSNAPDKKNNVAPHGWKAPVVAKKGDTLKTIANRVYKNTKPNDWKLIAKANGITDPKKVKMGQTIKIPKRK